jgi:hypothetical protein
MKIYNNTNITYSAIEHNSRENTKQNVPADLEKKMTQYTDTLSISKTGQESFRHLSSVSSMDYQNRFEKEVTDIFVKEDTESVKTDSFEHHVNRMAEAYNKMKNSIEEKYAEQDYEPEYYVTESGKIEELTKEKELDMLNQAYENHSNFMATSTEIWSELQDFTPSVVYHKGSETSVYKGYKQDKIEMRGDRAEMSDFPLYLNTVAGGLDRRDQAIGGFSFVVKIYAVPVVEIIG